MIIEPRMRGFICLTAHPDGCAQNVKNQIEFVKSKNPYWNDFELSGGKLILDPDGFGIIISKLKIF